MDNIVRLSGITFLVLLAFGFVVFVVKTIGDIHLMKDDIKECRLRVTEMGDLRDSKQIIEQNILSTESTLNALESEVKSLWWRVETMGRQDRRGR